MCIFKNLLKNDLELGLKNLTNLTQLNALSCAYHFKYVVYIYVRRVRYTSYAVAYKATDALTSKVVSVLNIPYTYI